MFPSNRVGSLSPLMSLLEQALTANYGYFYHPPPGERLVGYPRLDFNLIAAPTGEHFDPQHATLYTITKQGRIESLTLSHPWHGSTRYQVCAGRVNLHDHSGENVAAYTLGGQLTLRDQGAYTHCSLTSPAPIIDLPHPGAISTLLASEIESLLAQRRAALRHQEGEFERRLATVEPLTLFVACLSTLEVKLCHLSAETHSQPYQDVLQLVRSNIHSLQKQGVWVEQLSTLDSIL
jgi:hypothetical protein